MKNTDIVFTSTHWFNDAVKHFMESDDTDGVMYYAVGETKNGDKLYLVFGMQDGYDKGDAEYQRNGLTLCAKLAFNIDDLQCDYNVDWYMPWSCTGEWSGDVYDTDHAVTSDFGSESDYLCQCAREIINGVNSGTLEYEIAK